MRNKLMNNRQIFSCLVVYFIGYALLFNIFTYSLSRFISNINFFYTMQFTAEVLLLVLVWYLCKRLFDDCKNSISAYILFDVPKYYAMMFLGNMLVSIPAMIISQNSTSNNQQAVDAMFEQNMLYSIFAVAIFAPMVEELIYRGVIYKNMRTKFGVPLSILASSCAFGIMHFAVSIVIGDVLDFIFLPSYMLPAVFLCLIYEKHNNIFAPIFLHLLNNSIGIIVIIWGMM